MAGRHEPVALRLHQFLPYTRANGPGLRAAVWVQGCTLGCPGCFNPETHASAAGELVPVMRLCERIAVLAGSIEGITISGGEPLQQLPAVTALLRGIRRSTSLSALLFTGFTWEEVQRMGRRSPTAGPEVLDYLDVLIAGRYDGSQRTATGLLGSVNKSVHYLTRRYGPADLEAVPEAEVILLPDGQVALSGIDPVTW